MRKESGPLKQWLQEGLSCANSSLKEIKFEPCSIFNQRLTEQKTAIGPLSSFPGWSLQIRLEAG